MSKIKYPPKHWYLTKTDGHEQNQIPTQTLVTNHPLSPASLLVQKHLEQVVLVTNHPLSPASLLVQKHLEQVVLVTNWIPKTIFTV